MDHRRVTPNVELGGGVVLGFLGFGLGGGAARRGDGGHWVGFTGGLRISIGP